MTWITVFEGQVTPTWQYLIKTEFKRVRLTQISPEWDVRSSALIARAILVEGQNPTVKVITRYYPTRSESFETRLSSPEEYDNSFIAIKLRYPRSVRFGVKLEIWTGRDDEEDLATIKTYVLGELPFRDRGVEGVDFVHWLLDHGQNTDRPALEFYDELGKPQMVDFLPLDSDRIAISAVNVEITPLWTVTVVGRKG